MTHARARIHLENIVHNWEQIGGRHPNAEAAAVVKADGYGHGAAEVSRYLQSAGCKSFFVATLQEAVSLRKAIGDGSNIFVLNGARGEELTTLKSNALTPVLNSIEQVRTVVGTNALGNAPLCLHFDTGMNRLGLKPSQLGDVKTATRNQSVGWVMSHLACADEPDHSLNTAQLALFHQVRREWPDAIHSLAATAGCYLGEDYGFDMIRPGIGLYGGGPRREGIKPGLTLEAPILAIFEGSVGETVGYGATHTLQQSQRLATVSLGYADGMLRSLSNKGFGFIDGQRVPIVGRISMDLITIDVSDITSTLQPGKMVEFLGAYAHLEEQAKEAGSLGYELITGISTRVQRIYES